MNPKVPGSTEDTNPAQPPAGSAETSTPPAAPAEAPNLDPSKLLLKLSITEDQCVLAILLLQVSNAEFGFQPIQAGSPTLVSEAAVYLKRLLDAQYDAQTEKGKKRVDAVVIKIRPNDFDILRAMLGFAIAARRLNPVDIEQGLESRTWAEQIVDFDAEIRGQAAVQIADFRMAQMKAQAAAAVAQKIGESGVTPPEAGAQPDGGSGQQSLTE